MRPVVLQCSLLFVLAHSALSIAVRQLGPLLREMPFKRRLAGLVWSVAIEVEDYFLRFMLPAPDLVVRSSMRQHVVSRMTAPLAGSW